MKSMYPELKDSELADEKKKIGSENEKWMRDGVLR